jgi:hypothetical protein
MWKTSVILPNKGFFFGETAHRGAVAWHCCHPRKIQSDVPYSEDPMQLQCRHALEKADSCCPSSTVGPFWANLA